MTIELNVLVRNGAAVMVVFDDDAKVDTATYPFNTHANIAVFDSYANKQECSEMKADQVSKFVDFPTDSKALFMLNWTLTPPGGLDVLDFNIVAKAVAINPKIREFFDDPSVRQRYTSAKMINIVNIDAIDNIDIATLCHEKNTVPATVSLTQYAPLRAKDLTSIVCN